MYIGAEAVNPSPADIAAIRARDSQEQPFKQPQADRRMLLKALDASEAARAHLAATACENPESDERGHTFCGRVVELEKALRRVFSMTLQPGYEDAYCLGVIAAIASEAVPDLLAENPAPEVGMGERHEPGSRNRACGERVAEPACTVDRESSASHSDGGTNSENTVLHGQEKA